LRGQDLLLEIGRLIAQFTAEAQAAAALRQTDISDASDMLLRELLAESFQLPHLRNLNADRANFPALDLGDDVAGHAFQVTSDRTIDKVCSTLSKAIEWGLHRTYPKIQVFVTSGRQQSYTQSTIDEVVRGALQFDARKDILDYRSLLKLYKTFGVDRLEKIVVILRKHRSIEPSVASAPLRPVLERDLSNRFEDAFHRAPFPEASQSNPYGVLAAQILSDYGDNISQPLRRKILLRASRFAALRKRVDEAERFLSQAVALEGPDPQEPAQALLKEARGDPAAAMRLVRDRRDAESISVMMGVMARNAGDQAALDWIASEGIDVNQLAVAGYITLSQIYIRLTRADDARVLLDRLTPTQLDAAPYLAMLRGLVRLVSIFPRADQLAALNGPLLSVTFTDPILGAPQLADRLDGAIDDLQRVAMLISARQLSLPESVHTAEWYWTWAELMHPHKSAAAKARLAASMEDPGQAVRRAQLAIKYLHPYDSAALEAYLSRRAGIGGWDEADLTAALILRLHSNDHSGTATLIEQHRVRLQELLSVVRTVILEIQALTHAGQAMSARAVLEANRSILDLHVIASLKAEIKAAEGADPVAEYQRVYEEHPTVASLRVLVDVLKHARNDRLLGPYAEKLYLETQDPQDVIDAIRAYNASKDDANFLRLVQSFPFVLGQTGAKRSYAWLLLQLGRLREATSLAAELRSDPATRDLSLEIALAIDSGQWEKLSSPLSAYLDRPQDHDALSLIRAAQLAWSAGYGPFRELMQAAVAKSDPGAEVLLGAYSLAIEGGLEEQDPAAHEWFKRALDQSGPEGPVHALEIKDLLEQQIEWNTHSRRVNQAIIDGEVPLAAAAPALRTTLVDAILGNFVRNIDQKDPRKRTVLPLFSGRREPMRLAGVKRIALDVTSLIVLGYLDLLPKVFDTFGPVIIPAAALRELFDGQRRIRSFQRSRLARASQILTLRSHKLRILRTTDLPPKDLTERVGTDLATFLHAARASGGVLVRPAPVHTIGSRGRDAADLASYADCLTDTPTLLRVLKARGAVDQTAADTAERYFNAQDSRWPSPAVPDVHRPLYLDDVTLSFLQTTDLLDTVVECFDEVYVHAGTEEEALALLDHERHSAEVIRHIRTIREAVGAAAHKEKVLFGPRRAGADNEDGEMSTLHLLSDFVDAEAIVLDDRALNREPLATDPQQRQVRTATTLDLIDELEFRAVIPPEERWTLRHRLRAAGAALIPADAEEFRRAAERSTDVESAEFRVLSQSIALARVRQLPRFPAEAPWLVALIKAVRVAAKQIWLHEKDPIRAAKLADLIVAELPQPADWAPLWQTGAPTGWMEVIEQVVMADLALAIELPDRETRAAYFKWVEQRLVDPMRLFNPVGYDAVVERIRSYILDALKPDDGE